MPELPEVETTRRGVAPWVTGRTIAAIRVREPRLRWPVPKRLAQTLRGAQFDAVERRAKYLLFRSARGTMILHLGMSGSLRVVDAHVRPEKHDHVDIVLDSGKALRFRDPRRFGSIHWTADDPLEHKLLAALGPEPLGTEFDGAYLHGRACGRVQAVKTFIMDSRIVVGVGNIYANEALFLSGIHPRRAAGRIAAARYERLADSIRAVLEEAVRAGGTTLRDFVSGVGEPGYFAQALRVYDRDDVPCVQCRTPVRALRQGQRSTFYCPRCQR